MASAADNPPSLGLDELGSPIRPFQPWTASWPVVAVTLLIATVIIRLPNFGDPNYHIDESFYLLFGHQLQAGATPYLDVWDRKPFGLFLLYWLFAVLGGITAVHLGAMLASWCTALCIARITGLMTGPLAAGFAGMAYLAMQQVFHGGGGQAPVFYNCLMAGAALLTIQRLMGKTGLSAGYAAIALCGLSLTMKPTSMFEGALFGVCLLLARYRETVSPRAIIRHAMALLLIAAAPTLAIFTAFASSGLLEGYWFATVESIFLVQSPPPEMRIGRALQIGLLAVLLLFCAVAGVVQGLRRPDIDRPAVIFLAIWQVAAACGVFALANFHTHFALSWLVPLSVAAGVYFERPRFGPLLAIGVVAYPLVLAGPQMERSRLSRQTFAHASATIRPLLQDGCLFVYEAPPMLYSATGSCLPTARVFPEHLNNSQEARATGVDAVAEVRSILRSRPAVIAVSRESSVFAPNVSTRRLVEATVAAHYRPVGSFRFYEVKQWQDVDVYALRTPP